MTCKLLVLLSCILVVPAARAAAGPEARVVRGAPLAWTHTSRGTHPPISDPAVAVRSDGTVLLAWIAADGDVNHLWVVAPGEKDTQPVRVNPPDLTVDALHQSPAIVTGDAGEVFVSWSSAKPKPEGTLFASDLRLSRSIDGGRTFAPPLRINDDRPISHSFDGLARESSGDLVLGWIDARAGWGKAGTYVARVGERGGKVLSTAQVGTETCVCCRVAVGAGGERRAAVLWRKDFPGEVRDMMLALSSDDGATFAPAARVHDDGWVMPACPHRGGGVGIDGRGRVHAAWYTERADGRPGLFYVSSDDGRRFTAPQRIDASDGSIPDHVAIAVQPDGTVLVVWEDSTAVRRRVLARASRDGGATFGDIEQLSTAMKAWAPSVAIAPDGGFVVAWNEEAFPVTRSAAVRVQVAAGP